MKDYFTRYFWTLRLLFMRLAILIKKRGNLIRKALCESLADLLKVWIGAIGFSFFAATRKERGLERGYQKKYKWNYSCTWPVSQQSSKWYVFHNWMQRWNLQFNYRTDVEEKRDSDIHSFNALQYKDRV